MAASAGNLIRVGVSSCLLGNPVRFDAGHKRNDFLVEVLGRFVEWVPICPEFEIGLGAPRPTMRLERLGSAVRLVENTPRGAGADHTDAMRIYAAKQVKALENQGLSGYVLKKDSPSCGMERVRIYGRNGMPARDGRGLFAAELMTRFPHLPIEEEGRLSEPRLRENFIERLFAYRDLQAFFGSRWSLGGLIAFHTAHKLQLMAHSRAAYDRLGRMVAQAKKIDRDGLGHSYVADFMAALREIATPARHKNVLDHIAGHLREHLDSDSRTELHALITDYRLGLIPLIVPITLIRHHVRRCNVSYLLNQSYLEPHPKELMLRNRV